MHDAMLLYICRGDVLLMNVCASIVAKHFVLCIKNLLK